MSTLWKKLYPEKFRASQRRSVYRRRHGSYVKKDHCESCREEKKKLLVHHRFWRICSDCRRSEENKVALCSKNAHKQTLCYRCHKEIHVDPRRGIWQEEVVLERLTAADYRAYGLEEQYENARTF